MSLSARITRDDVSPAFDRLSVALSRLEPILRKIGVEIVSLTKDSFENESLRVAPWAPKRDGTPATLIKSGLLQLSIRIINIGATSVTVGSDRVYAAIQQLGGTIEPKAGKKLRFTVGGVTFFVSRVTIPPRPFFPIDASGNLSSLAQQRIAAVLEKALSVYLPGN
jgi:phage gpG-like protein